MKKYIFFASFLFILQLIGSANYIGGPLLKVSTLTEQQKIDRLIQYVSLSNALLIEHGKETKCLQAADVFRMKLIKSTAPIKTAREFIELVSEQNCSDTQPIKMRFLTGETFLLKDVLTFQLKKIEAQSTNLLKGKFMSQAC